MVLKLRAIERVSIFQMRHTHRYQHAQKDDGQPDRRRVRLQQLEIHICG